jgi:hypothetical protein
MAHKIYCYGLSPYGELAERKCSCALCVYRSVGGSNPPFSAIEKEASMQKVNVLGTEYTIKFDVPSEKIPFGGDGCMDQSIREIWIADFGESDRDSIKDLDSYRKKVLRHEIVHAFLYESGLWNNSGNVKAWGQSEEITDWIALQFPKMLQAFVDVGAIDLPIHTITNTGSIAEVRTLPPHFHKWEDSKR